MKFIKSCGFVVYRQVDGQNHYLVIKSKNGDVGFPKGHMECGESEIDTAIRELKEETGVCVDVVAGFRRQIEYPLKNEPNAIKQAVYFLGEYSHGNVVCQETEVEEAGFMPIGKALDLLTFEETKAILKDAERFVCSKNL